MNLGTAPTHAGSADRPLGWVLLLGGLAGGLAAFVLMVEKVALLKDPSYTPSCSINPILSCGSIMTTDQAEAFGFPNPLIGVATFPVVAATGALILAGVALPTWWWRALNVGAVLAVVFIGWLVFQSLYRIGALCPYCMAVWAVTWPLCWLLTIRNAESGVWGERLRGGVAVRELATWSSVVLTLGYVLVVVLIAVEFWTYWSTLL